jgi:hypothetical protein
LRSLIDAILRWSDEHLADIEKAQARSERGGRLRGRPSI